MLGIPTAAEIKTMADDELQKFLDSIKVDEQAGIAQAGIIVNGVVDKIIALKDTCEFNFSLESGHIKLTVDPKEKL